ncbi:hypothetical protein AUP68_02157 [Ilyonectria robusta]
MGKMADDADGYDKLARLMGRCNAVAVFRRFAAISVENLLYLQADLVRLENELRDIQQADKASGHKDRARHRMDWTILLESKTRGEEGGDSTRQLDIILEMKARLKEYHEALFYYRQTCSLRQPNKAAMKDLQEWMDSPERGKICLIGDDRNIWSNPDMSDLLVLDTPSTDSFTEWVTNHVLDIYHRAFGRRSKEKDIEKCSELQNSIIYSDTGIKRVTRSITIMIASLLPILTTVILYLVKDTSVRLGIVAGFTALFSLALGFFTRAMLPEIFSATAAFAAVCVVWVGTTSTSS